MTLQQLIDDHQGGELHLHAAAFEPLATVVVRGPITIHADGARIHQAPQSARSAPVLECRGTDVKLLGQAHLVGSKPDGRGFDPDREAQHGVELVGTTDFVLDGWTVNNVFGDALYVGKSGSGRWSRNTTVRGLKTAEIGRQQVTLAAADGFTMSGFDLRSGYRSIIDIEPPGTDWGALDVDIGPGRAAGSHHGYLLASLGKGRTNSVARVRLHGIHCHGRAVTCMVAGPDDVRRADIVIEDCSGEELVHSTPLRFHRCDGVTVRNIVQPIDRGVPLVATTNCTAVLQTA